MLDLRSEQLASMIVDCAVKVHKFLGPGLLESVYQACLIHKLKQLNLNVTQGSLVPIVFEGLKIESALKLDLLVDDLIIIELKAVEAILPVHKAQLLSYLRLSGKRLGFLLNFNVTLMKYGIQRFIL